MTMKQVSYFCRYLFALFLEVAVTVTTTGTRITFDRISYAAANVSIVILEAGRWYQSRIRMY